MRSLAYCKTVQPTFEHLCSSNTNSVQNGFTFLFFLQFQYYFYVVFSRSNGIAVFHYLRSQLRFVSNYWIFFFFSFYADNFVFAVRNAKNGCFFFSLFFSPRVRYNKYRRVNTIPLTVILFPSNSRCNYIVTQ